MTYHIYMLNWLKGWKLETYIYIYIYITKWQYCTTCIVIWCIFQPSQHQLEKTNITTCSTPFTTTHVIPDHLFFDKCFVYREWFRQSTYLSTVPRCNYHRSLSFFQMGILDTWSGLQHSERFLFYNTYNSWPMCPDMFHLNRVLQ